MSERGYVTAGVPYPWLLMVLGDDGLPVAGLVDGDFSKAVALNETAVDLAGLGAPTLVVSEVDPVLFKGLYKVLLTSPTSGRWATWVACDENTEGWFDEVEAVEFATLDDLLDTTTIDGTGLRGALKLLISALSGNTIGLPSSMTIKNPAGTKNRVVATLDGSGNRVVTSRDYTG